MMPLTSTHIGVFVIVISSSISHASNDFRPPTQTPTQAIAYARFKVIAAVASPNAHAEVLNLLDDVQVRTSLTKCCPTIANLSASELWKRYSAEMSVTEIVHGFPAENIPNQNNALDLDIDIAMNSSWFLNQWQLPLLYPAREFQSFYSLVAYLAPAAAMEVETWLLDAFTATIPFGNIWPGGWPASIEEASNRVVYAVLNQHHLDYPNSNWGNVGVVFKNAYIRNMTLLTPVDSGDFVCGCNHNFTTDFCRAWTNATACSKFWYCHWENKTMDVNNGPCVGGEQGAFATHDCNIMQPFPTGTLDNFDHLLLPYAMWYGAGSYPDRVAMLLGRVILPWKAAPNFTSEGFDYYYEADLLGNPHFPEAVNFVVVTIDALFGTNYGDKVMEWCLKNRWVLMWSLGPNTGSTPDLSHSYKANTRVADPRTTSHTNLTTPDDAKREFTEIWQSASQHRLSHNATPTTCVHWWHQLQSMFGDTLQLQPLRATSCVDRDHCFGVTRDEDCACYVARSSFN